jgi:hypothetical protein
LPPHYLRIAISARFSGEHTEEMRHTFNICWLDRKLPEVEVQGFQAVVTLLARDFQKLATLLLRVLASSLGIYILYLATFRHILLVLIYPFPVYQALFYLLSSHCTCAKFPLDLLQIHCIKAEHQTVAVDLIESLHVMYQFLILILRKQHFI